MEVFEKQVHNEWNGGMQTEDIRRDIDGWLKVSVKGYSMAQCFV